MKISGIDRDRVVPFRVDGFETDDYLAEFIKKAKQSDFFFNSDFEINWENNEWDLSRFIIKRNNLKTKIKFTDFDGEFFSEPFMDQFKALFCFYYQNTKTTNFDNFINCLRGVYQTLKSKGLFSISQLNDFHLDFTFNKLKKRFKDASKFTSLIELIFCDIAGRKNQIIYVPLFWSGPKLRKKNEALPKKMPSLQCIFSLAQIWHKEQLSTRDLWTISWFALSIISPSRINEILTLSTRCVVKHQKGTGLLLEPLKGGNGTVKWALSEDWAYILQKTVDGLKKETKHLHKIIKFYSQEKNSGKIFLDGGMEQKEGKPLSTADICRILGTKQLPSQFIENNNIKMVKFDIVNSQKFYDYNQVKEAVFSLLPNEIKTGQFYCNQIQLKWEDALFIAPYCWNRNKSHAFYNIPSKVSDTQIREDLTNQEDNIFIRHNLIDYATGQTFTMRSHQVRHFLVTLASYKNISSHLIAIWRGSKDIDQNENYNHLTSEHKAKMTELSILYQIENEEEIKLTANSDLQKETKNYAIKNAIPFSQAIKENLRFLKSNRFGLCGANRCQSTCEKNLNCHNCDDLFLIVGDQKNIDECKLEIEKRERALSYSIEYWQSKECDDQILPIIKNNQEQLRRSTVILDLLTDPKKEKGSVITLPVTKEIIVNA